MSLGSVAGVLIHPVLDGARGLLVDLDGTLVDSSAPVRRAWSAFARRHGLDPAQVIRVAQGRPSRETVGLLAPEAAHAAEAEAVERDETSDVEGVVALAGAEAVLGSGWSVAVVTSCSRALAAVRLEAAGLPMPEVVVTADDVATGKPDPECFRIGARRLGLAPERCVVLEDAPAGVAAGRAAGIRVIALRTTHGDEELREADAIVDDLAALVTP